MTIATTIEARPTDQIFRSLYQHLNNFRQSQEKAQVRISDIKNGHIRIVTNGKRTPMKVLINKRDVNRVMLREFLDGINEDEFNMVSITLGTRHWRDEYYEIIDAIDAQNDLAI